jgi:peptidoglycan-associated lipoprotein
VTLSLRRKKIVSRYLFGGIIGIMLAAVLMSGCAKKIQPPGGPQQGWAPPWQNGPVLEQELQAVQADLRPVYFDYDKYTLAPEAQAALQYNAEVLRRVSHISVVAEGHCDERGTSEYNLALGDRRARSAAEYLTSLGVAPQRVSTVSYGSEIPVDPAHNDAAWAKNRRVYLRISK